MTAEDHKLVEAARARLTRRVERNTKLREVEKLLQLALEQLEELRR